MWDRELSTATRLCDSGKDEATKYIIGSLSKFRKECSSLKSENGELREALQAALDKIDDLERIKVTRI